jgi:multiple sugar transport system ATP-binding protein
MEENWTFATGATLPLPKQFKAAVSAGDKVSFGIRPDDFYPAGHGIHAGEESDVHTAELPVSLTEPLGNETLVFRSLRAATGSPAC